MWCGVCPSLSYKATGVQIYMCKNNPVTFCLNTEATRPEDTVRPFSSDCDKQGGWRAGELMAPEENKKETTKEREK